MQKGVGNYYFVLLPCIRDLRSRCSVREIGNFFIRSRLSRFVFAFRSQLVDYFLEIMGGNVFLILKKKIIIIIINSLVLLSACMKYDSNKSHYYFYD